MTSPKLESLRALLANERLKHQHAERQMLTHARAIGVLLTQIAKEEERVERENRMGER